MQNMVVLQTPGSLVTSIRKHYDRKWQCCKQNLMRHRAITNFTSKEVRPAMLLQLISLRNGPMPKLACGWDYFEKLQYGVQFLAVFVSPLCLSPVPWCFLMFIGGNPSVHVFPSQGSIASNNSSILSSWPTLDFALVLCRKHQPIRSSQLLMLGEVVSKLWKWRIAINPCEIRHYVEKNLGKRSGMLPDLNFNSPIKEMNPPKITRVQGKKNENRQFMRKHLETLT